MTTPSFPVTTPPKKRQNKNLLFLLESFLPQTIIIYRKKKAVQLSVGSYPTQAATKTLSSTGWHPVRQRSQPDSGWLAPPLAPPGTPRPSAPRPALWPQASAAAEALLSACSVRAAVREVAKAAAQPWRRPHWAARRALRPRPWPSYARTPRRPFWRPPSCCSPTPTTS